ncbi:MAG: YceI family protein [Moraxellaceae bacterium]|nr:YceI family protein [Moraxellaceae bacterium]MDZ4387714.1 YceI family protein [Moraxellaceae bacterium]
MNIKHLLTFVVLMLVTPFGSANQVRYVIDSEKTTVNFKWHYFGRKSPAASFSKPAGVIYFNIDNPLKSSAEVTIPVRTLSTFMTMIDQELLNSGNFFKPETHPNITFRSTDISMPSASNSAFQVHGVLTANGISKPVTLQAKPIGLAPDAMPGRVITVDATTHFNRSDFGMTKMLGIVSDEMNISLRVIAATEDEIPYR